MYEWIGDKNPIYNIYPTNVKNINSQITLCTLQLEIIKF